MAEIEKRHHLHIVLTPRQYRLLCSQAKQCRLTKRAYLASLIEGQPVKSRPSQEIKDLRTEIHHIGNNINQIAAVLMPALPNQRMPDGDSICWIRSMN